VPTPRAETTRLEQCDAVLRKDARIGVLIALLLTAMLIVTSLSSLLYMAWIDYNAVEYGRFLHTRGAINVPEYNAMLKDHGAPTIIEGPPGDRNFGGASVYDGEAIAWPFIHRSQTLALVWLVVLLFASIQFVVLVRACIVLGKHASMPNEHPAKDTGQQSTETFHREGTT
jgi:hypothetical protein